MRKSRLSGASSRGPVPSSGQFNADMQLFRSYGDTHLEQGRYNDAVVMYMAALENASDDAELLLSLSVALMMSTPPQLPCALQDVQKAIQQNPNNTQAYITEADIHEQMGQYDEADAVLRRAIEVLTGIERVRIQQSRENMRARREQAQYVSSLAANHANSSPAPPPPRLQSAAGSSSIPELVGSAPIIGQSRASDADAGLACPLMCSDSTQHWLRYPAKWRRHG